MSDDSQSGQGAGGAVPLSREKGLRRKEERLRRQSERDERKRQKEVRLQAKLGARNRDGLPKKEKHSGTARHRAVEFIPARSYLKIGVAKGKTLHSTVTLLTY